MISASVIYCHPVKCSYEISDKYLSLSMAIPFLHMLRYFWAALFLEKLLLYNFTSFQINTRVTFPEQPFLQSRCFFLRSFFFETVTFSLHFFFFQNSYFQRAKHLPSNHILRIGNSFGIVTYSRGTLSKQILLHSINFFKKARFWKKLLFQKINLPDYLLFWRATFLIPFLSIAIFYSNYVTSYLFREDTFPQLHFPLIAIN